MNKAYCINNDLDFFISRKYAYRHVAGIYLVWCDKGSCTPLTPSAFSKIFIDCDQHDKYGLEQAKTLQNL